MELTLHNYQRRGIDFILENETAYIMIDVGLGKTAIALHAIKESRMPAIIFAPLRVATIAWPEEIDKWDLGLSYTILHGKDKDKNAAKVRDMYLISYSSVKWFVKRVLEERFYIRYYFLILDEASMVKSGKTQRFKLLSKILPMCSPYRISLSATPNPNGYHELWSQYFLLDDGARLGTSFYSFKSRYFHDTGPPMYKFTMRKGSESKILQRIEDITFRLDGKDYLELPKTIYNKINVRVPPPMMKRYKEFEKNFMVDVNDRQIAAFSASEKSMKLRQFVQGAMYYKDEGGKNQYEIVHKAKVKALKELLESNSHHPVLCAVQFKFEYDMICEELKQKIPIIAGRTSILESLAYINQWNAGRLPLLLCHPASLGHGMNLQTGGNIIVWYGLTWSLEQYLQLNGRLARQGQLKNVVINSLVMEGTVDEIVYEVLKKKDAVQQDLLDALLKISKERYALH